MAFHFRKKRATGWVEESFTFDRPVGRQISGSFREGFIGSSVTMRKAFFLFAVLGALAAAYVARIISLQFWNGESYRMLADRNRVRIVPIPAERGGIYDRNGIPLTKNVPSFSLAIVPQDLPRDMAERNRIIERLSAATGKTEEEIRSQIETYKSYRYESVSIADNIEYDQALRILIQASDLPGIAIVRGSKRLYLSDPLVESRAEAPANSRAFAHVLGYVGKLSKEELEQQYAAGYLPSDSLGKTGIEKTYESALRGSYGRRHVEVNALGREQAILAEDAPEPGQHVVLAIDARIQSALFSVLSDGLLAQKKARGAAVALDPRNGDILGIVSIPTYDNNDFSGGISPEVYAAYIRNTDHPLFPRAWSGAYPSGSTVKPAIAAAALAEGVIAPRTTIVSTGGIAVGQWFFPDWLAGGHGSTDVRKSLAQSVNTFYYYVGGGYNSFAGLGVDRLVAYLASFGFGAPLGIDIPGETGGFVPTKRWKKETKGEEWYIGDTYNLSIGQGDLLVTPIQIASMTASIANGGTLFRPRIAAALLDPITKKETAQPVSPIRNAVVPNEHLEVVRLGMRDCVLVGSCHALASLPFASAGKTGTAQWSAGRETHAWFTSFAPFERPEIVVTVLVEEGGEGGISAEPIAKNFYRWWWSYAHGS